METRPLRSPPVGFVSLSIRKQILYSASLSMQKTASADSTSWWTDRVQSFGAMTVLETFEEG
jgi:hypothetical protein